MTQRGAVVAILVALLGSGAAAQQAAVGAEARRLSATRAELEALVRSLDLMPATRGSGPAAIARRRLAEGDFQRGDGVQLLVQHEPELSDTFVVGAGRDLTLPSVGAVSLYGVLYSEIEAHLAERLGWFLVDPVVRARGLVRVSVTGAVAHPGFYLVGVDALLSDAVMAAGGLTADAKLGNLRVERGGVQVLAGAPVRQALAEGRTLAEADIRSGDQFVVPGGRGGTPYERLRFGTLLLSIPLTVYGLTRIF